VINLSVEIGKYGRIVLPKELRDKHNIKEGSRLIIRDYKGQIILIPVANYAKPTEALYASVRIERSIEEPKELARTNIKKKLIEEME